MGRSKLFLQTLIAGRKSRERDFTVFAHESFVLAWFLRISGQSINLDEDPNPTLIVRIGFCTAKSLTLCVLSVACTHFKLTKPHSILNTIQV